MRDLVQECAGDGEGIPVRDDQPAVDALVGLEPEVFTVLRGHSHSVGGNWSRHSGRGGDSGLLQKSSSVCHGDKELKLNICFSQI